MPLKDFLGGAVVRTPFSTLRGDTVRTLARELKLPCLTVWSKKKKKVIKTCVLEQELLKFSVPQSLTVNVN